MLGNLEVEVANGVCTYQGTLAGSVLTLDRAVMNFAAFTGCSMATAARMASHNPAQMLGVDAGTLAAGKEASFNILAQDGALVATILRGTLQQST